MKVNIILSMYQTEEREALRKQGLNEKTAGFIEAVEYKSSGSHIVYFIRK